MWLPLIGNAFKQLAKSILIPLRLTAAAVHKKPLGSGFTALIISNEEMNYIMKIVTSLDNSGLLIKGVN